MTRQVRILVIFVALVGSVERGNARPSPSTQSTQAELAQAKQLDDRVDKLYGEGKFQEAISLAKWNLSLREKALGPKHPDVAQSLNDLAVLYQSQGAYGRVEPLLVRALGIREKALGPRHPAVAESLNNLALLYRVRGEYGKAEPLYVRVIDIGEKALGPMHPNVATGLGNLAVLYQVQGEYGKAEPLLVRALDIREKALGPMHPGVATSLSNLALVYKAQGAYRKAEPLLVRALDIRERVLGPMHPDVARSLSNLAGLYDEQGAHGKAEPLYVRALDILEKALGPMHPDVATGLNNLALVYLSQRAYGKAWPLCVRALDIREKALGPKHPDVATSLNNLAGLYLEQGAYGKAEPLYDRALDIWKKALGPKHPDVATSLNNLARLYEAQGAYGKAEPLYDRALDIWKKALGPKHPDVATSLNNLARLYEAQGAYGNVEPLYVRAADIRETQLRIELPRLSESRKRALIGLLREETEARVSFHAHSMPSSGGALELAVTTVLRNKGRVLDSLAENQAALRDHLTPRLRGQLDELALARAELTTRLYSPVNPKLGTSQGAAVAALRARIEGLESELSAASAEFRVQGEPVTVTKVQAALPRGVALVELVRYRRLDARKAQQRWQEEHYVAYVLRSSGPPQWVALGEAAAIDAGVDAVLATMHQQPDAAATKAALQRLHALVLAPLDSSLSNVSHVIVAPDGKLNLVPFEALMDPQGRYELEHRLVSYVTTGRDLLRLALSRAPRSLAVLLAGPDYGPVSSPEVRGRARFLPLAGAAAEASDLRQYFPAAPLTGTQATRAALKALRGPAILHVATHGFYQRDLASGADSAASGTQMATRGPERGMHIEGGIASLPSPPRSEDPAEALDRAGLAMAGANRGAEGIVTAREIAGLDWWGTQLVVLSACQTAVGEVPSGEGVYGMRRALVLAGAESQVVTLWNVWDEAGRELMRHYYGELAQGSGRAEALRQAKLRMLREGRYAHPYYWAAFISAGGWNPLRKGTLRRTAAGK